MSNHYHTIPDCPDAVTASAIIARLLDGLGFRFRWATEGLAESDYTFLPSGGLISIGVMISHIWGLMNWIHMNVHGRALTRPDSIAEQREHVLEIITGLRRDIIAMNDEALRGVTIERLPFWHLINGPISDAIGHVGQINVMRRLAGNPPKSANVFTGVPPSGE